MKFQKTAFTINVYDLMHHPGRMREQALTVRSPEKMGAGLVAVEPGTAIQMDVRLESVHEGILATADVSTTASGECGRCLRPIDQAVQVDFQELFAYPSEDAFYYEVHDDHVDLEPLVRDAVVLSLPFQPVCRPDCPGLDPETGERLDEAAPRRPRENLDPRWAALADFRADGDED